MKITSISCVKSVGISALLAGAVTLMSAVEVSAHGYVSSPKARIVMCRDNNIERPTLPACIAAKEVGNSSFYTPQSIGIGGARDNHEQLVPDGKLCSAGLAPYQALDLVRNDWPTTRVQAGVKDFVWTNTAPHPSMYFRYYITKQGYNPNLPLKWSDLEQIYQSSPIGKEGTSTHPVPLPPRTGKHVVYSVWQRAYSDAPEGFYQCIDVEYGVSSSTPSSSSIPSSSSTPSSSPIVSSSSSSIPGDTCAALSNWDAAITYNKPQQVKYNNKRYQANYWTSGNNPAQTSGQFNFWLDLGDCVTSGSSLSSVTPPSSSSSSIRSSLSSSSTSSSVVIGSCTSPVYVNGTSYAKDALVQNGGSEYRCTVAGWCSVGGPYVPGTGWAWANAWSLVRSCQ